MASVGAAAAACRITIRQIFFSIVVYTPASTFDLGSRRGHDGGSAEQPGRPSRIAVTTRFRISDRCGTRGVGAQPIDLHQGDPPIWPKRDRIRHSPAVMDPRSTRE
jgi:hypothetical protein